MTNIINNTSWYNHIFVENWNWWLNILVLHWIWLMKSGIKSRHFHHDFFSFKLEDISWFPVRSQQCLPVPTHIFRPGNTGTAERTGGTICSFSTKTWGLWTKGKKDTQYPKSLSQGHHVKNSPSSPPPVPSLPPFLFSSLLFFFNQAVWGCQVFWDEDSQPCEKLIPCGPSSPWRSSPWEHWWWLAGRWWWVGGGGKEEGWMRGWTQGHPDQWTEWHRFSPILHHWLWSPHLNLWPCFTTVPCHINPTPLPTPHRTRTHTHHHPNFTLTTHLSSPLLHHPASLHPLSLNPSNSKTFWWGSLPDRQTAGIESREDLRRGELVEWLLKDDSGSQWRGYSCCIVPQTSPAQHRPQPTTPSHLASTVPL